MLTSEERARIERLESIVRLLASRIGGSIDAPLAGDVVGPESATVLAQILALAGGGNQLVGVDNAGLVQVGVVPPPGPQAMGGDVQGTTAASIIVQIAALAGGGTRFISVNNAGLIGTSVPPTPPFAMGGDVTGNTAASVLSKIAALAGGGVRFVAVDNFGNVGTAVPPTPPFALAGDVTGNTGASVVVKINGATVPVAGAVGNVLQVTGAAALGYAAVNLAGGANFVTGLLPAANQASQAMAGDVTGTTAASVVSKIAALGGSGTVLVAVNNAGNIISGGAPTTGGPTYLSVNHVCPAGSPGAATAFDFDFSSYVDAIIDVEVRVLGTTKGGTAHMTGAVDFGAKLAVEVRNGVAQLGTAALGGYKNIFQVNPDSIVIDVGVCDSALLSGGSAPMSAAITFPGAGIMRMTCTNQNALNAADVTVFLTCIIKLAP